MWMLLVSVLVLVVTRVAVDEAPPLRCRHDRCRYIGMFEFDEHRYEVDGKHRFILCEGTLGKKIFFFLSIICILVFLG